MSKTYIKAALRKQVYKRAKGCCEYCLIPDITEESLLTKSIMLLLKNTEV